MTDHNVLLDQLRAAVGASHVLTEGDLSAWEREWRGRLRGKALAVVRPATTRQVADVVRACAPHPAFAPSFAAAAVRTVRFQVRLP